MTVVKPKGTATVEDLLNMPDDGQKHELVDGEILVSPTGVRHAEVAERFSMSSRLFWKSRRWGRCRRRMSASGWPTATSGRRT